MTALDGDDDMVRGLEAGADEFLTKPVERVVLRARIRAMLRIRERFSELRTRAPDLAGLMRRRREDLCTTAALTTREREVLDLLLLGRTYQDIGTALGITSRTAKFHALRIFQKLGAESRVDLLRLFG
ncbi:MAG: LuxR C-terminal-related transcriptional regulator [Polyangiaceae bacterium]